MSPRFEITIDRQRGLLKIVLGGFFGIQDVAEYVDAKSIAIRRLGCKPNQHLTLCDVTACNLQAQEVVKAFKATLDDPRHMSRRLAVVVGDALARMQVRRILTRTDAACFQDSASAEDWLFRTDRLVEPF